MTGADLTLELTLAAVLVGGGVLVRFAGRARRR
jgi:hypothetical protein